MITVIAAANARVTETPNAVMTTLASPTLGGTAELSLWRVEMKASQLGPWHTFDAEQVWTVESGRIGIADADGETVLEAGDTAVLPAGVERQIRALADSRLVVCGQASATVHARGEDDPRPAPPWIS